MDYLILKLGVSYQLRNGLVTLPLRKSKCSTNYKFTGDVQEPQHLTKSVLSWKINGKFLTNDIIHEFDIIKQL